MGPISKQFVPAALGLALLLVYQAPGIGQPSPEHCTRCYKKLQQDNADCQTLKGQDWQICREAAATAYEQCSKGC